MASTKTVKPAPAAAGQPASNLEQPGGPLNHPNNPKPAEQQASPDDRGESDFDFFRRHPNAQVRNRLPFENEFTPVDLAEGGGLDCFVRAIVQRNPSRPLRRARWLLFVRGGNA